MKTPWGNADTIENLGDGIVIVTTSSHGGVYIPGELLMNIPTPFYEGEGYASQRGQGWFEEDCDMSIAIVFFPEHFRRANLFSDFDASYVRAVEIMNRWHSEAVMKSLQH